MSNYLNRFRLSPQALWNLPLLWSNTEQMSDRCSSSTSSGRSSPYIYHVFLREMSPLDGPCEHLAASLLLRVYLLCGLVEFFFFFWQQKDVCAAFLNRLTHSRALGDLAFIQTTDPHPAKKRTKVFNIFCRKCRAHYMSIMCNPCSALCKTLLF